MLFKQGDVLRDACVLIRDVSRVFLATVHDQVRMVAAATEIMVLPFNAYASSEMTLTSLD